jgi:hypothetical protein
MFDYDEVRDLKDGELFEALIRTVSKNEHSKAELIVSRQGLAAAKALSTALYKISSIFENLATKAYEKYLAEIDDPRMQLDAVHQLCAYKDFLACKRFYMIEKGIIDRIIYEYNVYVQSGHLLESLLGYTRSDMRDYTR